eukprot:CAMPEP_0113550816 /NCGR_PEP_ID=MMETSP0015_2-20120614/14187_1 /TAXON_ID=2838 /ORGANISM="Odontella" /LENGTH=114 /DNA_ID=CAMNT_0000451655 /DNA_START=41 /DNA_END=385 /DNA_ORIENTATION=+ /assembly_acc=CAM_ASM_000160
MALRLLTEKATGFAAKFYQRAVAGQLQVVGLRYEDVLNDSEKEVAEALELADPDVRIGRNRRIKRALDLSQKRKNLQDYAPNTQPDPFKVEIYGDVEKIKAREQEYALLNLHNK